MKKKLGNIATIQTGVFAKPVNGGEVAYLQVSHFRDDGNLAARLHPDLYIENINPKHLLKQGDVIFAAKGYKNFAAVYENRIIPAVASTSFFVIRLNDASIIPEYLAWFINHPDTQSLLKANAYGTAMASIPKAFLMAMEIPIPTLDVQQQILKIFELRKRQKILIHEIDTLREILILQKLIQFALE